MKFLIASRNLHKILELRALLRESPGLDVFSLLDFPEYLPPPEEGQSLLDNATKKALDAAQKLGMWALGDDTGLFVPALQGAPGVRSGRYAGESATDGDNRKRLLQEVEGMSDLDRQAYFECCLVVASPRGCEQVAGGVCWGTLLPREQGGLGFGYDSIFSKFGYNKSFAEIDLELKNRISHRRKAFDKIVNFLQGLANSSS